MREVAPTVDPDTEFEIMEMTTCFDEELTKGQGCISVFTGWCQFCKVCGRHLHITIDWHDLMTAVRSCDSHPGSRWRAVFCPLSSGPVQWRCEHTSGLLFGRVRATGKAAVQQCMQLQQWPHSVMISGSAVSKPSHHFTRPGHRDQSLWVNLSRLQLAACECYLIVVELSSTTSSLVILGKVIDTASCSSCESDRSPMRKMSPVLQGGSKPSP